MKKIIILTLFTLPLISSAALTFSKLVQNLRTTILTPLVGILLTLALVMFFYGMVKYIKSLSEKDKKDGKELMIWGIISLFVMVSVWGLVAAVIQTIGLENQTAPKPIVLPGTTYGPSEITHT